MAIAAKPIGLKHFNQSTAINLSPHRYKAVIFDMDGVVTQTATVHAAAWKTMFDQFLQQWAAREKKPFRPFDDHTDYLSYVDGKKREDGITSFLSSRNIQLPEGQPEDAPEKDTVYGLGKRKNQLFLEHIQQNGVPLYQSTIALIRELHAHQVKIAIVSASTNSQSILETTHIQDLFDTHVDGLDVDRLRLKGKPAPDMFLQAARQLGVTPDQAVVVEDAIAGVQAGKAGHFGLVIGVDREHHAKDLRAGGADIVVPDLSAIRLTPMEESCTHYSNLQEPEAAINDWVLSYHRYVPEEEGRRETLCALGNGYFVTRAAAIESHDDGIHYPGTYLAGRYNRLKSAVHDQVLENEDLVNFPNWLVVRFQIEDAPWFSMESSTILVYEQTLNLQEGVLHRKITFRDKANRETHLSEKRLVHMGIPHQAALEIEITPLNWSGKLTLHSALDGTVINNNVKSLSFLNKKHLAPLETEVLSPDTIYLKMKTNQSEIQIAQAARTQIYYQGQADTSPRTLIQNPEYIGQEITLNIQKNEPLRIEKILALYTSKDPAISECGLEVRQTIAHTQDFQGLLDSHVKTWKHLWDRFDITMETQTTETERRASLVLRLHIFHFLQTLSVNSMDLDIGVPARGWHGEGYRGHVFWDDILVLRFLNVRMPDLTASLLKYRYRRLDEARCMAREAGYQGAMFPWQSGSNGREETPMAYPLMGSTDIWVDDYSHLQRHVNADIVYNIWEYYELTGDVEFMFSYGAEIILEIARFWASIATYNPDLDRYEISGIVGPDEYHTRFPVDSPTPGVKNNTYTNLMAVWVLCKAMEVLSILPGDYQQALMDKLELQESEIHQWDHIRHKMRIVMQPNGILSQFEGFDTLPELDWERYRAQGVNLQHIDTVLANEGDSANRYQVVKQADVLMLFYLFSAEELAELFQQLGYPFNPDMIPQNIEYYTKRTAHGSTLSRVVHSWVLSRMDRTRSFDFFVEAFESDLNDIQGGTTPEGIHLGAMAGTVDIVQRCYTGLVSKNDTLWFNPQIPDHVQRIRFIMHYRFHALHIDLTQKALKITILPSLAPHIKIGFKDQVYSLKAGQGKTFKLT